MALPIAEDIIKRAENGEEITAKERRHAIAFLQSMQPENTGTQDLVRLFKVSDRQIRIDKQQIREEHAKLITDEDIGLVIADIRVSYENSARELYRQAKLSKPGSAVRLSYIKAQHDMLLKTVEALQNLGYYPKNLGTQTTNSFEYIATVDMRTGDVETHSRSSLSDEQFSSLKANQAIGLLPEYIDSPPADAEDENGSRDAISDTDG